MKNNKGFSLLEIMAVLALSTIILVPLLNSLSNAYNANIRAQQRSNAMSISESSMLALEKIDFQEMRTLIDNNGNNHYFELDADSCQSLEDPLDISYCETIFSQIWNNETYTPDNFKIYLFDFRVDPGVKSTILGNDLPDSVITEINNFDEFEIVTFDEDPLNINNKPNVESLIRVVVWINYNEDPYKDVTTGGMIGE